MSFVFDQIDAMERMRGAKDEALDRIRAWRQTKKQQEEGHDGADGEMNGPGIADSATASERAGSQMVVEKGTGLLVEEGGRSLFKKEVELVHPWPEWIELMERLMSQNYFDHRRFDENQMVKNLPIDLSGVVEDVGFDFTRDWSTVRTACLNFGRDRFDILRSLSKRDLQVLVGHGCPSTDKKVAYSAKLLRKHAHLDEGDVCSSCKLRSSCSSGFLLARKEDEPRTLDVMRILLTFAFDSINSSVENKALMEIKTVKRTVRKLLHEVTKLSAVPIDPNLPIPVIKRPPPKVKQPPPPPKRRVGRDDIEMKKGDWLCPKCDFMNFAKNNVCLQCDAKRPKRQLLPGEWECNFLNYRRNMSCFHCDHQRPPDEFTAAKTQFHQPGPRPRLDQTTGLSSQAWNFDFDDNESDGADVAAFEFADPPITGRNPLDSLPQRGPEDAPPGDRSSGDRLPSDVSRTGFDDFDDDEDDDVDSYEIDDRAISRDIPKFRNSRGSADHDDSDDDDLALSQERDRPPLDFPSDRRNNLGRNCRGRGTERPRSYDSDDGFHSGSDSDDFGSSRSRMNEIRGRGPTRPSVLDRPDLEIGRGTRGKRTSFNRAVAADDDDDDDWRHGGARSGRNVGMRDGRRERDLITGALMGLVKIDWGTGVGVEPVSPGEDQGEEREDPIGGMVVSRGIEVSLIEGDDPTSGPMGEEILDEFNGERSVFLFKGGLRLIFVPCYFTSISICE
ncbi:unnamed protein product [Spirodela intermedia]|uniref:RanBP2-type domain-containing protein n=1 Tax=Spirodela intermedia TaxID=51605 RepID=A0A7I8JG00_SPIIN|nr:unnamed protein product [Spirodela intermedia]CAA6669077.1 unnamed protein product [Spirodela intermedia]